MAKKEKTSLNYPFENRSRLCIWGYALKLKQAISENEEVQK
jgi:hypothetical protein